MGTRFYMFKLVAENLLANSSWKPKVKITK